MQNPTLRSALTAIAVAACLAIPAVARAQDPSPDQYKVDKIYSGKTKMPQFKGRDKAYRNFRTRIHEGLEAGPNLAGEYSVIQFGCGSGCSSAFVASNRTGQVFDFPRGGENAMYLTLQNSRDSRLLIAQWAGGDDNACQIEFYEWKGDKANLISTRKVGVTDECFKDIKDNLK